MWRMIVVVMVAVSAAGCSAVGTDGGSLVAAGEAPAAAPHQTQAPGSAETLVPYTGVLTYPDNWVALSRRRMGE